MSFEEYDLSISNGSPTELFKFVYNDNVYRFCTLDGGVPTYTMNAEVYTAASIRRPDTEMSEDMQKSAIDLTVPKDFPIVELFFLGPPEGVVSITVFRLHVNDSGQNYITVFKGRVLSCNLQGFEAIIRCEPVFSSLRRPGLRMVYETQCVHGHYETGCNLNKDSWAVPGYVLDADGIDVVVQQAAAKPDDWYKGGVFICGDVRRMIMRQIGANLELMQPVSTELSGKECIIYPGCDHTIKMCAEKFNNAINALAFRWLPAKDPFTGDNIFW